MTDEGEGVRNVLDPDRIETHSLEIQLGYLHGEALAAMALAHTGESSTAAVADARRRAHNDVTRITNALASGDLVQGGLTGVEIVLVARRSLSVDELARAECSRARRSPCCSA